MSTIRYLGRAVITGTIKLLSGLHIGAGKETVEIGGLDNPVIKHPHTGQPYIPGSSLKGKLRHLLEWEFGKVHPNGQPWGHGPRGQYDLNDPILRIFGCSLSRTEWDGGPTRLIVRDAPLDEKWVRDTLQNGLFLTEEKTEVVIDRIAGKAAQAGPRTMERVPAGAKFNMEMVFRFYDTNDGGEFDKKCFKWLLAGLSLLEQEGLGGSVSRGYGRVQFEQLRVRKFDGEETDISERFRVNRLDPKNPPAIVEF